MVEKRLPVVINWYYSPEHGELCRVIETQNLWGEIVCRVWLPGKDIVVRLPASQLRPVSEAGIRAVEEIIYRASAARVADALTQDVVLAPLEASVIPLPHQISVLKRAISTDRIRYLLADEVGLGKTIEAGLIMRELKLRGLVKRTMIITPRGLLMQWVAEMDTHFNEQFYPILSEDYRSLKRIFSLSIGNERAKTVFGQNNLNPFCMFDQVIVSMDSVKPLEGKGGEEGQERFEDLISANWDLVIVDEAHRLGGSTDHVARYRLGRGVAEVAPYLLLLSATPHQGKTDQFHRLISLLDPDAFPDEDSITKERVQPYVIRTEKRRAIDVEGKPLFTPRRTELMPVFWKEHHHDQRLLYEMVTDYVRKGYNQAMREKRTYIGFLMILMQRLVISSTRAIRTTLQRRLEALEVPQEQFTLFPQLREEEWTDLDGQEQMDTLLKSRLNALENEQAEVKLLLEIAKRCENQGPDAKAEALLDWIYQLQAEEGDPELKVLVFTEFVPTQEMLSEFLTERGFKVVCLNGSMGMKERKQVQDAFAKDARVLISTDAGGEGLNLQFCHVVINYDIPWNPMRLEQRIGRVDRIGQTHPVRAINFVFKGSVEHRILQVLEEKLAVIFEEFGIDKTGDVLDSAQTGKLFDDLYIEAILNPDIMENKIDEVLKIIQEQAQGSRQKTSLFGETQELDPKEAQQLLAHPFPHWVERMTISYLQAHGGKAERKNGIWELTWPDGERLTNIVFSGKEAERNTFSHLLTLEDPKVRNLVVHIPIFAQGQPVPVITLPGLAKEIKGFWSLWKISISSEGWNQYRIMPLFIADNGKILGPTARYIWDQLLVTNPVILRHLDIKSSHKAFERLREAAEQQGKTIYDELVQVHQEHLMQEHKKAEYAFTARRKAILRIGLPQVRNYRLRLLEQEEQLFKQQLAHKAQILPEIQPLLILRIEKTPKDLRST